MEGLPTKSPSYDGPVGQVLKDGLELLPIVDFEAVCNGQLDLVKEFPEDFIKSMNNDTKLLYLLYIAIMEGPSGFKNGLADRKPGHVHQVISPKLP